jgi:general secretion pathway protein E
LFEIIRVDDGIRQLIADGGDELKIAARAFANSPTLAQAAQELVSAGITSRAEAMRVTRLDADNG